MLSIYDCCECGAADIADLSALESHTVLKHPELMYQRKGGLFGSFPRPIVWSDCKTVLRTFMTYKDYFRFYMLVHRVRERESRLRCEREGALCFRAS